MVVMKWKVAMVEGERRGEDRGDEEEETNAEQFFRDRTRKKRSSLFFSVNVSFF